MYILYFLQKAKNCVLVEVPDLEILTEGKDMSDAIEMAWNAIELNCVSRVLQEALMKVLNLEHRR